MVYRHSFITRLTHAAFALCFFTLAITGAQLFARVHWIHANVKWIHIYCGFTMIATGAAYLLNGARTGEFRKLLFNRFDTVKLLPMTAYYLRLRDMPPYYDRYNPLQKLAYTIVLLTMGPLISLTGLALWGRIGGRPVLLLHLGFAAELLAFFFGHMAMVAMTGLRKNMIAIVTGWYESIGPARYRPAYRSATDVACDRGELVFSSAGGEPEIHA